MVCKKSVFPQIIILITNNYMFPAPLPFFFFFSLDISLIFFSVCFFFSFLIRLVLGEEGELGFWGSLFCSPFLGGFLHASLPLKLHC